MTREYKFRGKRTDNGEWVYGYYFTALDENETIVHVIRAVGKEGGFRDYFVYEKTVGQFIGLSDKNGKEIYADDLVRHGKLNFGEEKTPEESFPYVMDEDVVRMNDYWLLQKLKTDIESKRDVEIIGNVHENPELMILNASEDNSSKSNR